MNKQELQQLAKDFDSISFVKCQLDDIHECERLFQIIKRIEQLDKSEAIRFMLAVIEVKSLFIEVSEIHLTDWVKSPFKDMDEFNHIDHKLKEYETENRDTLY
jgi:hypothetical protein